MEECIDIAKKTGQKIGEKLNIPIYLYENAATNNERKKNVSIIR